jgi:hypothetical protein
MPSAAPILSAAALAAVVASSVGCETFASQSCDTSVAGNPAVTYAGGTVQDGVYQSAPWGGDLLWFPGGSVYDLTIAPPFVDAADRLEAPRWVTLWVSFSSDGTADGGVLARASANEAVILGVTPGRITVQNQGCQDFSLLVTAGTGATQP